MKSGFSDPWTNIILTIAAIGFGTIVAIGWVLTKEEEK